MKNLNLASFAFTGILALGSAGIYGCSGSPNPLSSAAPATSPSKPAIPSLQGEVISAGSIPPGESQVIKISNGAEIVISNRGGMLFHEVEGTMSKEAFNALSASLAFMPKAERDAHIGREIGKIFGKVARARGVIQSEVDEIAYFTFLLPYTPEIMASLKNITFDHTLLLNPVVFDRESLKQVKQMTPATEGLVPQSSARDNFKNFSGLERLHAPAFVQQAEADIGGGVKVNGSSVRLGITDTGMTLNHPTFRSALDGRNRVEYLKDFTREGRIYFNPNAKFEVVLPTDGSFEDLTVNAQIIPTPKLPDVPAGDTLMDIKNLQIKVGLELRKILTTPGSGAKLGVLFESALNSEAEPVDINGNGKITDQLLVIMVPGKTPELDSLYFDPSGTGDFRNSKKLMDYNTSKSTMNVFAETIGFNLQLDKLPKADASGMMDVHSASIVGYDPGNHGSHVAGIAAGSKTIANDSDLTLARGVAPEARILLNRVCANNAGCGATKGFIDLATSAHAEVINMSLGGLSPFNDGFGVQETTINRLTSLNNVLFVISAGNSGPGHQTVGSPSTARLSLSVGATASKGMIQRQYEWPGSGELVTDQDDEDFMLFFSSRGPTAAGGFKPNVTAPGTELSSVQLNSAPGAHAGLDVYWGTSMAAPAATGAYALFLDAIKKYNLAHPEKKLTTNVLALREVLIESARGFDVSTFDPATGAKTSGRYTWVDQGKGMVDLTAAWKKLFELRDGAVPSAIVLNGQPIDLDYTVVAPAKSINGITYDGTRAGSAGTPAFGTGVYLDYAATDTLRQVHISRRLPEFYAAGPNAGPLTGQLVDTYDEFVLKTVIYGSELNWIKAGVLDGLNCASSSTANLTVFSRGVDMEVKPDGTATISPQGSGNLNICIDREMIAHDLPQGDNGAIISAYRVVNGHRAALPSFTVPVYVTVPHKTLTNSAGYVTDQVVRSFDVSRNYVTIPKGTNLVKITLEVPAIKTNERGLAVAGEECSGVELMALMGTNTSKAFSSRAEARIFNCDANGAPVINAGKRILTFSKTNPNPGVWDIHVFGSYKYARSKFRLKVDYINSTSTLKVIEGGLAALTGSLEWTVKDSSLSILPDSKRSRLELSGLYSSTESQVAKDQKIFVPGASGLMRKYSADVSNVTITTGGSRGNDIDLAVLACASTATTGADPSCLPIEASGSATDEESVTFSPENGKLYVVRVDGYEIKDEGKFTSTETMALPIERGVVTVAGETPVFQIGYSLSAEKIATSKILTSEEFTSGKYTAAGSLVIRTEDLTVLSSIPVRIKH